MNRSFKEKPTSNSEEFFSGKSKVYEDVRKARGVEFAEEKSPFTGLRPKARSEVIRSGGRGHFRGADREFLGIDLRNPKRSFGQTKIEVRDLSRLKMPPQHLAQSLLDLLR